MNRRRQFMLTAGGGLFAGAMASLLNQEKSQTSKELMPQETMLKKTHFPARAKNVIFLFMSGAPSQQDLLDHKPKLEEMDGKPIPESFIEHPGKATFEVTSKFWGSPYQFEKVGDAGMTISSLLPNLKKIANDICLIRSMTSSTVNHHPGEHMLFTGVPRFGHPSLGSWLSYGIGSENQNLPAFIVMNTGDGTFSGANCWSNGFLPASHQGVHFRLSEEPILSLRSNRAITREMERQSIDAINDLNRIHHEQAQDPIIDARIKAYEKAFAMQAHAPELVDLNGEPEHIHELYGMNQEHSFRFGKACLLARRMVERGVRFVQINHGSWDGHIELTKNLDKNCKAVDQPSAALVMDLKQRGLLEDTLIVWGGEFGRTSTSEWRRTDLVENKGRDHHANGFCMWMAGGGIKPATMIGETDELGIKVVDNPIHVHDLQATMLHCLGLDHKRLTYHYEGREHRLTDVGGTVRKELLV